MQNNMDYLIDEAGTKFDQMTAGFLCQIRGFFWKLESKHTLRMKMCRNRIADDGESMDKNLSRIAPIQGVI